MAIECSLADLQGCCCCSAARPHYWPQCTASAVAVAVADNIVVAAAAVVAVAADSIVAALAVAVAAAADNIVAAAGFCCSLFAGCHSNRVDCSSFILCLFKPEER